MTDPQAIFLDGARAEKIGLSSLSEEAWVTLFGQGLESSTTGTLYRTVPWFYRAVHLRAQAVSSIPWAFVNESDEDVFTSEDQSASPWPWLVNPGRMFYLAEASLSIFGAAYFALMKNDFGIGKELRWFLTPSIKPIFSKESGLGGFTRRVGTSDKKLKREEVIYHWLPDPFVEIGPGSPPAAAAMCAAGVLENIDHFTADFFKRGAIKATILSIAGQTTPTEREKLKSWWSRAFEGIRNAWSTEVFNMDALHVNTIGEGLESLANNTLTNEKREDISTGFGIPQSILFSNAANFAVSQQDELNFYNQTVIPQAQLQQENWNEQLFAPMGYRLEFRPNEMSIFQEDEEQRAGSLLQLTQAMAAVPREELLLAMDILGYDLTDEQRAMLEREPENPEPAPVVVTTPAVQSEYTNGNGTGEAHMQKWLKKSLKAHKAGRSAAVPFESDAIPAGASGAISGALSQARTEAEIREAFAWEGYP